MTDERDPLLDEIGRALAIDPSPEFAARVRLGVRQRDSRGWPWPLMVSGGVAAAAIVFGTVMLLREAAIPSSPLLEVAAERPGPSGAIVPTAERSRTIPGGAARRGRRTASGPGQQEVMLPAGQLDAVQRWMAQVQRQPVRAVVLPSSAVRFDETGELVALQEIAAIEWPTVTIEPLEGSDDAHESDEVRD
jgi:hypothetical protein